MEKGRTCLLEKAKWRSENHALGLVLSAIPTTNGVSAEVLKSYTQQNIDGANTEIVRSTLHKANRDAVQVRNDGARPKKRARKTSAQAAEGRRIKAMEQAVKQAAKQAAKDLPKVPKKKKNKPAATAMDIS
eukprot:1116422-Rhodomonas_salina.2